MTLHSSWEATTDFQETDIQKDDIFVLPTSFAQARLWFLDQFEPGSPFYNIPAAVRLTGKLNVVALQQSLNEMVQRHEALRTTFAVEDGQPVQVIRASLTLNLPIVDLTALPITEREAEIYARANAEIQQPFDLTQVPLWRVTLLRLDEADHVLLLTMHHIISDGWSLGVFLREMAALYEAFSNRNPSPLPELPIQYADFAVWQRDWLHGKVLETQLNYWKQQLSGSLPVLRLPSDRPRPAIQSYTGKKQFFVLSKTLTAALKSLSQQTGVTLFMTMLAAFKTLAHRYTNQDDLIVGSAIANRNRAEVEGLIGLFVNTLVLRTDLSGNPTFKELLNRVREVTLGAYAHQDLPFEKLVEELQPERDLSQNPLFQVWFALNNAPMPAMQLASGLTLTPLEVDSGTAHFDLSLDMVERGEELIGSFEYNTDLFDATTISRMVGHFQTLLEGIVADCDRSLSHLPLLTEAEQHQLLVDWNDTQANYPQNHCIHQLFEAQVEKTPDAVAVVFENQQLTYAELNAKANQLAHHLQKLGVKPEVLVGICIERSLEMVVGLLGILKAGGAYLSLDPAYPPERLAFMLEDAQVSVLLTQKPLLSTLPSHNAEFVCLDDWESLQIGSPNSVQNPSNLAYVIYTSGSTGRPKGVQISHGCVVNFLISMGQKLGITQQDNFLAVTSLSFDIAALEIFLPLTVGSRVVVVPREIASDGAQLLTTLTNSGATIMQATPATWRMLLAAGWQGSKNLKILCGGEALPRQLAAQLLVRGDRLWNLYGPTETTIWSTIYPVESSDACVSIGRPIANTQVYILDRYLQPVPVGVTGELYIGGKGLSRGYLNRPELTAEKFIPNPFLEKSEKSELLYKTGDLVRYIPDGNLEFLGRIDHQVKIRGFRIEPGEIEAVLAKHPAIEQTVVLAQEDDLNTHRLVAYLTTKQLLQDLDKMPERQWYSEQLSEWGKVFEKTYHQNSNIQEDTLNISSWKSSYTGLPIPAEEMRMWVDRTVEQILALQPSRVLEIGCGSGLLLFPIAPHSSHYLGTNFSQSALDYVQQQLTTQNLPQVTLDRRLADNFEGIEAGAFDAVIINSVIQYFPSTDYLLRVLEGAVNAVKPGGSIFIGDVRSLPLLEAFHASVQMHQAPSNLSINELRQRIHKRLQQEEELIIDPEFFRALKHEFSKISHVQIQPKPGKYQNELTKFRYDVILRVGSEVDCLQDFPWLNWQKQNPTVDIRKLLEGTNQDILGITGIPNARLASEMKALELLAENDREGTVADLRSSLRESNTEEGIEPEEILALGKDLSYCIHLNYLGDHYDAVFVHKNLASPDKLPAFLETSGKVKPWRNYANNPLRGKLTRELVPQLRDYLQEKLPKYMVPSKFILLEELPLTPNGKIDRRSLITLSKIRPELDKTFVAPRTAIEQAVANIYAQILNLQQVGSSDNFFELGGHSLLATQVTSRLRETFQVELPLRTLFESPTVAELAEVISTTQQAKQSLNSSSIPRVSRNQPLPLSFAQQRLWFLDNLEPGSPDYNIPAPVRLVGQLDVAALEQSFNEIVRRHEILRTSFVTVEGKPIQEIAPTFTLTLPILDLQMFLEAEREKKVQQLIAQEALKPFDLTQAPLFRIQLLQLGEEEHILVLVLHHIIFDLWSIGVLLQEVTELYKAFTTAEVDPSEIPPTPLVKGGYLPPTPFLRGSPQAGGSEAMGEGDQALSERRYPLPELPIQYGDFAVWQRQYLQGEVLEKHLSYWKQQLSGNLPLELPSDRSRSTVQSNRGAIHYFAFPKDLSDAIQAFSQREGATLFMTLSAAFKTLLYAYTGQQDILIGSPIANRERVELEPLIGFFVNTLVLRTNLSENPSFRELLARVREVTLGAYAHQDLPFEKLVEALQPNRKQSEFPLFKVWIALENAPIPNVKLPKLTLSPVDFYSGIARYDLRLGLTETNAGLKGSLEYKAELFDATTIARIVGHLEAILRQAVAQPDILLEQLASAIAQAEQQEQIVQEKELAQTSQQKLKRVKRKAMHG